jgi:predicted ArsR family transcriptional regulator
MKRSEDRTRDLVARTILENGPQSAADLASRLQVTPAGIRRHLDSLVEAGVLEAREPYRLASSTRGRGRPSKVFVITDEGRAKFEHSYDDLAVSALRFMSAVSQKSGLNDAGGSDLVSQFAQSRAEDIKRRVGISLRALPSPAKKSEALAAFLSSEGYAAESKSSESGVQLCQHHCPVAHVASEFPQLCEAETEAFSHLLGTHVQRLATIALGDGICTTFIPSQSSTQASTQSSMQSSTQLAMKFQSTKKQISRAKKGVNA